MAADASSFDVTTAFAGALGEALWSSLVATTELQCVDMLAFLQSAFS